MDKVKLGSVEVSKFILGSNPISGYSHQSIETDAKMLHYFNMAHTKELMAKAEALGVTTFIGRSDHYVKRLMMEYWDDGGKLQWISQSCSELGTMERGIQNAIDGGASACYIHGGIIDHMLADGRFDDIPALLQIIRDAGMPAGIAGHNPEVFRRAELELDLDFYMCCYYNPTSRDKDPNHKPGASEWFYDKDRDTMVEVISKLSRPVIHYKIMAAGRNNPEEAFAFAKKHMRPTDAVCVGIYDEDDPDMIRKDVELLEKS